MIRLLVVEDDPVLRSALSLTLETAGFAVTSAADAERAIAIAVTTRPDVILMDIMLPGMTGWEAKQRLAAEPAAAAIPVIGVTALGDPDSATQARELGFAGYLVKPIRLGEVTRAIEAVLDPAPQKDGPSAHARLFP
jgi:CheY-like chemotaxis protein